MDIKSVETAENLRIAEKRAEYIEQVAAKDDMALVNDLQRITLQAMSQAVGSDLWESSHDMCGILRAEILIRMGA